nr:KilA-N domain-containing protein [Prevotella sp. tc2-28]
MAKINVQDTEITVISHNDDDYISLTDMARSQLQEHIIFRWLSLKSTIEYLGEWEMLYNPNFNCTEFGTFRNMAGSNSRSGDSVTKESWGQICLHGYL